MKAEFLNQDKALSSLRRTAGQLRRSDPPVQEVILFGSLVKGEYVPGSDADLLVILDEDPRPFIRRIAEFRWSFLDVPIDVEVFSYTHDEWAKNRADRGSFIHPLMAGPTEILA